MVKFLKSIIANVWISKRKYVMAAFVMAFTFSCSLFEYHPYETNLKDEHRDQNDKAIKKILNETAQKDTLTVIAMGDTQRFYDEVEDFVASANSVDADFILLNGDITDFGLKDEYQWVHDIMSDLNKPYLAVIGNHDLSGNGEVVYKKMYGEPNVSFIVSRFKFILLNTNSREYKFNGAVPDISWLRSELTGSDFDKAVVVSHIPPYDGDFDPDLEQDYVSALQDSEKVDLSLHAHQHSFREGIPYNDGIRYVVSTSMDERMYLVFKLFNDGFTMEKYFY